MKICLLELDEDELCGLVISLGEKKYRAKQIEKALYMGLDIGEMTVLSLPLREKLNEIAYSGIPSIERKLVSRIDGTVKYLFRLHDGECVESVVMKYEHGYSECISSQVGCNMGCRFCASTIGGKVRDLSSGELAGQVIAAQRDLCVKISHIVMMGIGEPLDNYENTVRFLHTANSENGLGISYRNISLSTCGIVDKIYALAKENMPITLSVSLHASSDEVRSEIMPVNRRWGTDELLRAARDYFDTTGRRISFEYTLIYGKNDSASEALKLAALLRRYFDKGVPLHVNLIPVNEVKESGFKKSSAERVELFRKTLCQKGINATVRRHLGADINASCGQLRRSSTDKQDKLDIHNEDI